MEMRMGISLVPVYLLKEKNRGRSSLRAAQSFANIPKFAMFT